MAVRTEAVQYHSCDLCGHDRDEADLVRLYGPRQPGRRAQIDVCVTCQERPVADVIKWLVAKQHETALRPLRSVRALVAPSFRAGVQPGVGSALAQASRMLSAHASASSFVTCPWVAS
jgi:hypothetical protein